MLPVPLACMQDMKPFLLDKRSGNITLNVQNGLIRGWRVELIGDVLKLKP